MLEVPRQSPFPFASPIRSPVPVPLPSSLLLPRPGQVRLCEQRDVEKWLTTKALKANGLWRLGKYEEAIRLCLEVQVCFVCICRSGS